MHNNQSAPILHLDTCDSDLHTKNQSAYRCFHSVETVAVLLTNDLLCAVNNHGEDVLVLLNISTAFDTVDH